MHTIPYYKVLMLICLPFSFCFFLIAFWTLYKIFSKQSFIKVCESFLITAIITFFYFQSSIITALANLLNCTKIEDENYLTNYLFEKCAEHYYSWRNLMILPAFFFFSIILTILPFIYMFKNMENLYTESVLSKIAFLLHGYSAKHYYW